MPVTILQSRAAPSLHNGACEILCRSLPRLRVMAVLPRALSSGRMHPPRVSLTRRGGRRPRWEVNYPLMSMRLCSVACAYGRDGLVHHKPASLGVILTLMCTGCDLKRLAHTSALQRGRPRSRARAAPHSRPDCDSRVCATKGCPCRPGERSTVRARPGPSPPAHRHFGHHA